MLTCLSACVAGLSAGGAIGWAQRPIGPESVQVEPIESSDHNGSRDAVDPIERELNLQRAIAESLKGNPEQAIQSLAGTADDTPTLFAGAMWLLEQGEIAEGVQALEIVARRPDAPPETQKFLAVGYLHLDKPKACEIAVDAYLNSDDNDSYSQYLRGLAILRQNQPQRAADALRRAGYDDREVAEIQQVMMQAPVDVRQRRLTIDNTLGTARQAQDQQLLADDRPYNFTLLFAGEYDSNVPLQPHFSGLGSNIDYEDYRFLMASFLDVQLLTCEQYNIGLVGSTYGTFQLDANEFNIQDYMGGMYANAMLLDDWVGSFRYEFHYTLVDESRFASEHRVTPSLTWLRSQGHTTLYYEFNPVDASAPALIPAQLQSGETHRIGLTEALYTFDGDGRVYGGGQYANSGADGSDFDRNTIMLTGRIEQPLRSNCIADLGVRYFWDDYDNPNSLDFFDRPRDDNRWEVRAGLQKNFSNPISLRLDYTYINNDSNTENLFGVRFYDYDRHIVSTQLIFSL